MNPLVTKFKLASVEDPSVNTEYEATFFRPFWDFIAMNVPNITNIQRNKGQLGQLIVEKELRDRIHGFVADVLRTFRTWAQTYTAKNKYSKPYSQMLQTSQVTHFYDFMSRVQSFSIKTTAEEEVNKHVS